MAGIVKAPDQDIEWTMALQVTAPMIVIWVIPLEYDALTNMDVAAILSPAEVARAERFVFAHLRQRYLAAHAAMRLILSRLTGELPQALPLCRNEWGKPGWRPHFRGVAFNMSYGAREAVLALAPAGAIGVDIEDVARFRNWTLAGRLMTAREKQDFDALPPAMQERANCKWWTSKEAVLKAAGYGLTHPLGSFSVEVDPRGPHRIIEHCSITENITLSAVALDSGRAQVAVAARDRIGASVELRWFRWPAAARGVNETRRLAELPHE